MRWPMWAVCCCVCREALCGRGWFAGGAPRIRCQSSAGAGGLGAPLGVRQRHASCLGRVRQRPSRRYCRIVRQHGTHRYRAAPVRCRVGRARRRRPAASPHRYRRRRRRHQVGLVRRGGRVVDGAVKRGVNGPGGRRVVRAGAWKGNRGCVAVGADRAAVHTAAIHTASVGASSAVHVVVNSERRPAEGGHVDVRHLPRGQISDDLRGQPARGVDSRALERRPQALHWDAPCPVRIEGPEGGDQGAFGGGRRARRLAGWGGGSGEVGAKLGEQGGELVNVQSAGAVRVELTQDLHSLVGVGAEVQSVECLP
mmetsp:Transcript_4685/g.15347  ORF Transcript_4685/g.15347 Transcript_4685/m.15347 type:complete len:311 (-) Transcript_4685:501-1433(-)